MASCATGRRPISASRSIVIYMVQWYAFAAVAIVMWAVVHLRHRVLRADD